MVFGFTTRRRAAFPDGNGLKFVTRDVQIGVRRNPSAAPRRPGCERKRLRSATRAREVPAGFEQIHQSFRRPSFRTSWRFFVQKGDSTEIDGLRRGIRFLFDFHHFHNSQQHESSTTHNREYYQNKISNTNLK